MAKDFSNLTDPPYPMGIVQNNPGDLRSGISWVGLKGNNKGFCVFSDLSYGIRALAVDLSNKINTDGLTTIREIISVYAPPSENDTDAYINAVAGSMNKGADDTIEYTNANLQALIRAITDHELGPSASMIDDADIAEGISIMPQSWLDRIKAFFVSNPVTAAVAGYGIAAVVIVAVILIIAAISRKKIKIPYT